MITSSPLGPTLETERLILRPPVVEDFDGFCAFCADAEAMQYLGGVQSPAMVWRMLTSVAGAWHLYGFHMFSVLDKASGAWIGRIGPLQPFGWPGQEVGWGLMTAWQGRGLAREAAVACMDHVTETLGWDDVIHTINPDNRASAALAQALGSVNRGPGKLSDPYAYERIDIWGQSRADWRENRKRFS